MKNGWHEGTIGIPEQGRNRIAHYWVKAYEKRSPYGINGCRISKLEIRIDGSRVALYDRGWDMEPEDEAAQIALAICLDHYN